MADGSLELLLRRATGWEPDFFELESFRVIADHGDGTSLTEATVKVRVGDDRVVATAEGNGPVNALDSALRQAIGSRYPVLSGIHLVDYRVRVLDTGRAPRRSRGSSSTPPTARSVWTTIGVSENIIEASWQALFDSIVYGLLRAVAPIRRRGGTTHQRRPGADDPTQLCAHRRGRPGPPRLPAADAG